MNWISVDERQPETGKVVIVVKTGGAVTTAWLRGLKYYKRPEKCAKWQTHYGVTDGITHWMPLPEPPK